MLAPEPIFNPRYTADTTNKKRTKVTTKLGFHVYVRLNDHDCPKTRTANQSDQYRRQNFAFPLGSSPRSALGYIFGVALAFRVRVASSLADRNRNPERRKNYLDTEHFTRVVSDVVDS